MQRQTGKQLSIFNFIPRPGSSLRPEVWSHLQEALRSGGVQDACHKGWLQMASPQLLKSLEKAKEHTHRGSVQGKESMKEEERRVGPNSNMPKVLQVASELLKESEKMIEELLGWLRECEKGMRRVQIKRKKDGASKSFIAEQDSTINFEEQLQIKQQQHRRQIQRLNQQLQQTQQKVGQVSRKVQVQPQAKPTIDESQLVDLRKDVQKLQEESKRWKEKVASVSKELAMCQREKNYYQTECERSLNIREEFTSFKKETMSKVLSMRNTISYLRNKQNFEKETFEAQISRLERQVADLESLSDNKLDSSLYSQNKRLEEEVIVLRQVLMKKEEEYRNLDNTLKEALSRAETEKDVNKDIESKIDEVLKQLLKEIREVVELGQQSHRLQQQNSELLQQRKKQGESSLSLKKISSSLQQIEMFLSHSRLQDRANTLTVECSQFKVHNLQLESRISVLDEHLKAERETVRLLEKQIERLQQIGE